MRVVGVLDVMGGQVVRGLAGRRHEYRPIVSSLTPSCQPADVARVLRARFGLEEFYLADLDAIEGGRPAWEVYAELAAEGFRLWVDAGVREVRRAEAVAGVGAERIVVGLETVGGPADFAECVGRLGERVVFSLDLRADQPLGGGQAWEAPDAWGIARQAVELGACRLLVLDLARVGVGTGTGTEELCERLSRAYPEVEISAGGGVRGRDDLELLRLRGVKAVLVASALHDGSLKPADLLLERTKEERGRMNQG
jgi:HisA/HisF family protein